MENRKTGDSVWGRFATPYSFYDVQTTLQTLRAHYRTDERIIKNGAAFLTK